MAGKGSRFINESDKNPDYKNPKPFINVLGKPMIEWALESLPFVDLPRRPATTEFKVLSCDLIFICRPDHETDHHITERLKSLFGKDIRVIITHKPPLGALYHTLEAKNLVDNDEAVIVSDCDHYFDGTTLYQAILHKDADTVGVIPVFPPPDNEVKWSYTLFDKNHTAHAVGEKDPNLASQGAHANIGGYYFSSGALFVREGEEMISQNDKYGPAGKEEFYLAPLYNRLIKKGIKVKVALIPEVWGLGTPKDLENFVSHFHKN